MICYVKYRDNATICLHDFVFTKHNIVFNLHDFVLQCYVNDVIGTDVCQNYRTISRSII